MEDAAARVGDPSRMAERRIILMVAIGERPWAALTAELFARYAAACGAEFRVETALPDRDEFPLPPLPDAPGRRHKAAYACKTFFAWRALSQGYDRMLVVDDSCVVRPDAPDVFATVPPGRCGGTRTSARHAGMSFDAIRAMLSDEGGEPVPYDADHYMNTGVMLYDRSFMDALAPERIIAAKALLFATYPHQTLSYYLLMRDRVPIFLMPKLFNSTPAPTLPWKEKGQLTSARGLVDPDAAIVHVTGAYHHRDRILPELAWDWLNRYDPECAGQFDLAAMLAAARRPPGVMLRLARRVRRLIGR